MACEAYIKVASWEHPTQWQNAEWLFRELQAYDPLRGTQKPAGSIDRFLKEERLSS